MTGLSSNAPTDNYRQCAATGRLLTSGGKRTIQNISTGVDSGAGRKARAVFQGKAIGTEELPCSLNIGSVRGNSNLEIIGLNSTFWKVSIEESHDEDTNVHLRGMNGLLDMAKIGGEGELEPYAPPRVEFAVDHQKLNFVQSPVETHAAGHYVCEYIPEEKDEPEVQDEKEEKEEEEEFGDNPLSPVEQVVGGWKCTLT